MKKKPIKSIQFIKGICALGIVFFHFACRLYSFDLPFFINYANGGMGGLFVTVFFCVSGALLFYNYSDDIKVPDYLFRRWKAIYPMFYLAYLYYWIQRVTALKTPFYGAQPAAYLFTLLGIDGYVASRYETYYILGEWFLGAIIALYLLFPLLLKGFQKNKWLTFAAVTTLFVVFYGKTITNDDSFCTISSCLFSFTCGMMVMAYREYLNQLPGKLIALGGCAILLFIKLPFSSNIADHLAGIFLFAALLIIGEQVMKVPFAEKVFQELGKLSYPIFLVHHQILEALLLAWQPGTIRRVMVLLVCAVILILCEAKILSMVTSAVMKKASELWTAIFRRKERIC